MECFKCKSASNPSGKEHCTLILSSVKKIVEEIKWFDIELIELQARLVENLGKVSFEEEIKKRFKMVYVPHWFTVDLKIGVRLKTLFSNSITFLL